MRGSPINVVFRRDLLRFGMSFPFLRRILRIFHSTFIFPHVLAGGCDKLNRKYFYLLLPANDLWQVVRLKIFLGAIRSFHYDISRSIISISCKTSLNKLGKKCQSQSILARQGPTLLPALQTDQSRFADYFRGTVPRKRCADLRSLVDRVWKMTAER